VATETNAWEPVFQAPAELEVAESNLGENGCRPSPPEYNTTIPSNKVPRKPSWEKIGSRSLL
jgi:hypothetical protein